MDKVQFELSYFTPENEVEQTSTAQDGWIFRNNNQYWNESLGIGITCSVQETEAGSRLRITREDLAETRGSRIKELTVLLPDAAGHENDGSELVLPLETGMICRTTGKLSREYRIPVFCERKNDIFWCNMSLYGKLDPHGSTGVVLEGGKYDCELRLRTAFGNKKEYRIDPVYLVREWENDAIQMREISLFRVKAPSGELSALAAAFRKYNKLERKLPSLLDKCKDNPALAYSMKAMTVRFRMAVKKLPCQVYEQTRETAPVPKAFMKYKDVENIAKVYRENGIGPSEFNLVGWNYGGHDGGFPQLFPVCGEVGTEDEIRHTVEVVNQCGYKLNLHDNYFDAYTLAENFHFGDVCTDDTPPFNMPVPGGGILCGGRAYRVCAKQALKYEKENLKMVKERFPSLSGPYYIDVATLAAVRRCADPQHPETRSDNADHNKKLLQNLQQQYGVSMSEGGRDWSLPELDRAYMLFSQLGQEKVYDYTDEAVPLYQMIYHGYVIYNTLRTAVNSWPGSQDYLYNLSTGGMPLLYYHQLFRSDWSKFGWKNDLFATPEAIKADMPRIKQVSDDVARVSDLAGICICSYIRHENNITETRFENGVSIFANYGETQVDFNGIVIPPLSFTVHKGAL